MEGKSSEHIEVFEHGDAVLVRFRNMEKEIKESFQILITGASKESEFGHYIDYLLAAIELGLDHFTTGLESWTDYSVYRHKINGSDGQGSEEL